MYMLFMVFSKFSPPSYSVNVVNGHIVQRMADDSATAATDSPLLQRIHAAKSLKEKVSSMLRDAQNINLQAKALRSQASYARQQAADVKAEEDALRSKILDVSSHIKVI